VARRGSRRRTRSHRSGRRCGCSDWIEFDVRLSSDGVPVIIHDQTLKRTTNGRGPVRARSLAELRKLDAGSWFDPRFAGEKMPTLDEVLKLGPRVKLNIEIKARSAPANEVAKAVWTRVHQAGLAERVLVSCFDLKVLRALRELDGEVRLGFPWQAGLRDPIRRATTLRCKMMLFDVGGLSEKKVRRCREVGLEVWVYTVNEPDEMRRVLDLGIDGLITDRPDLLARMVRREAVLT